MREIKLYTGGGASYSVEQRPGSIESAFVRLVADDGRGITDGESVLQVADVRSEDVNNWTDCELLPEPDDPDIDDSEALEILTGGGGE